MAKDDSMCPVSSGVLALLFNNYFCVCDAKLLITYKSEMIHGNFA